MDVFSSNLIWKIALTIMVAVLIVHGGWKENSLFNKCVLANSHCHCSLNIESLVRGTEKSRQTYTEHLHRNTGASKGVNANGQKPIGMTFSKRSDFELHTFSFSIHSYKIRISDHILFVTVIAFVGGSWMISISNEKKVNEERTLQYNSWWEKRQCNNEILTYCSRTASTFFRFKFYRKTMHIQSVLRSLFFKIEFQSIDTKAPTLLSSSDCAFRMQSKTKKN